MGEQEVRFSTLAMSTSSQKSLKLVHAAFECAFVWCIANILNQLNYHQKLANILKINK